MKMEDFTKTWKCDKCGKECKRLFIIWGTVGGEKVDVIDFMCPHCNHEKLTFQGTDSERNEYWMKEWDEDMKKKAEYIGNCVVLDGDAIQEMSENAEDLGYDAFIKIVPETELATVFPDYAWNGAEGLPLKDDFMVDFCKSEYDGKPCLYIEHSRIEYVWILS